MSEQLDDKELHGAPGSARGSERILVFWTTSPARTSSSATERYAVKGLCKLCCTAVMNKSNTPYSSVFLQYSVRSCIRTFARSLLSKEMFTCSVRTAFENPYICSSLFGESLRLR